MTTSAARAGPPIPARVSELTAEWFSQVLRTDVRAVDVVDAHSGTTGRARVRLSAPSEVPDAEQPIEIARAAMIRTTEAIDDLDAVGLLEERLGGGSDA